LSRHIADVIDSLQTREVEVRDSKNRWWLVRFRPYRTTDHRIDGAVLAFVDIDLVKRDLERTTACATPKAGR
jgi:two-component system CheB/CheR fusion protein